MHLKEVKIKNEFSDWESCLTDELYNVDDAIDLYITDTESENSDEKEE